MAFKNKKDSILKFYETTHEVVDQHKQTYGKLVNKLNEKVGLTQTLTNNLDSFMSHSFPKFDAFKQGVESQPLEDAHITHVYDINKNAYVTNFTLPNKKIVIKQHFKCVLMENKSDIGTLNNGTPWTALNTPCPKSTVSYTSRNYMSSHTRILETNGIGSIKKVCNCNSNCNCTGSQFQQNVKAFLGNSCTSYHKKETKDLEIWIDDYFNIYIPSTKTYLVYNYSKFPLFAFFNNMDQLNLYHNHIEGGVRSLMFNEDCPKDLKAYNLVKSFVDSGGDYLTSRDKRTRYKTLFPQLLEFYHYHGKQSFFYQFQNLSEKLEQLAPSAATKVIVEDEDTMNDEKKIFSQSQRIRELEIVNHKNMEEIEYLRNERTQYIEKDHNSSSTLADYQKLLEELNGQLHNEIDNVSNQQKDIIRLKNVNLEYSSIKTQYRRLEDVNKYNITKLNETEENLSKMKTLNSTLVDKQLESHQKLMLERTNIKDYQESIKNLNIDIVNYGIQIRELHTTIKCEKEQHIISNSKIDDMIASMSTTEFNNDDQYQEILLSQLKDKNDEIKQIQVLNSKLTKDIQTSQKEFSLLKSQVSALLSK